ncbi:MAG TPA: hypothetical protein VGO11_13290 [Chthoniobacteraceae bacterium]|jgi:hypothetical protein|nr:hypothetical protein [Chthoniobacteraceae bacterium]
MKLQPCTADDLVGTYRTFGTVGPAYEVIAKRDGEKVHVRVLESGEELDYPVRDALEDPVAQ